MEAKRMRVFAGPNGSGKTTIFRALLADKKIELGTYVNADDIEAGLIKNNTISFSDYNLAVTDEELKRFFESNTISRAKRKEPMIGSKLQVIDNTLSLGTIQILILPLTLHHS